MKVIYTRAKLPYPAPVGVQIRNPRFFTAPEKGATAVYINGDFPVVAEAYAKLNVPVAPLSELEQQAPAPPEQLLKPSDQKPRRRR